MAGVGIEARRSSRVPARFWVAVEGVDAEMIPRLGDISATGIFFEVETDIGDVGTVQWLHVASHDKVHTVHVMAHVVRVASLADVHRKVKGVALEFMPETDDAASQLLDFVRYVLDRPETDGEPAQLSPRLETRAAPAGDAKNAPASLSHLSVHTLLLETDWTVPVGEKIRVEIIARGARRPVRVEGEAVSVVPSIEEPSKRFRIAVRMNEEINGPLRRFSSKAIKAPDAKMIAEALAAKEGEDEASFDDTIDQLLSALIQPTDAAPIEREHLSGLLSRIPFTALCSLLELEHLTGELRVRQGDQLTTLFVRDGRFVDIDSPSGAPPKEELARLMATRDGKFDLVVVPVEREDRVGMSMMQLLLDSAREADERGR